MLRNITRPCAHVVLGLCLAFGAARSTMADVLDELRNHIEELTYQAAELREAGRHDRAEAISAEIDELQDAYHEHEIHQTHTHHLQHIAAAAESLRALGRTEAAEHLERIAEEIRVTPKRRQLEEMRERQQERMRERVRHVRPREPEERREWDERTERESREVRGREIREREREREQERQEHPEIRAARQQLEVLLTAKEVLAEAGRERGVGQLQQAIRALEVAIEGRRDEEAREIRRSAPGRNEQAEWLMLAHRQLQQRGRQEAANQVGQLAERFAGRNRRSREQAPEPAVRELQAQIRQLARQLEELRHRIEDQNPR